MWNLSVFYVYLLENLYFMAPIMGLQPMFYDIINPYFDFQTLILLVVTDFLSSSYIKILVLIVHLLVSFFC